MLICKDKITKLGEKKSKIVFFCKVRATTPISRATKHHYTYTTPISHICLSLFFPPFIILNMYLTAPHTRLTRDKLELLWRRLRLVMRGQQVFLFWQAMVVEGPLMIHSSSNVYTLHQQCLHWVDWSWRLMKSSAPQNHHLQPYKNIYKNDTM